MPGLIGKRIGGQTYYCLREVARAGGKPKIVSQRCLGKADDIAVAMGGAAVLPERARHLAFADWWAATAAGRWVKIPGAALDHRRFWEAMDAAGPAELAGIERRLGRAMAGRFGLDLSALVLDMTNFATFTGTGNEKAPIARRGKAGQRRDDLRLAGLALVVTRDGGVPVVSHACPGDRPGVTQFTAVIDELVTRYHQLAEGTEELTVVFDAGNYSAASQDHLAAISGLHFAGSLVVSQHPGLLAIPASRYRVVDQARFGGLTAVETTAEALGQTRRVIVTHSPAFHARQARGFEQSLAKARRQLTGPQARLTRGHTRKDRHAVQAEIGQILRPRWLHRVLTVTLTGQAPPALAISFRASAAARRRPENEVFGKRILFTDRDDWPAAEVIAAYRSQADAEAGFRQLKDRHLVSFWPMFHWTEQKIRVHVFYCVLALAIAHLMRRHAAHAGLNLSIRELLHTLAGIGEAVLIYPSTGGRPKARRTLTEMTTAQQHLFDLFGLAPYAPHA